MSRFIYNGGVLYCRYDAIPVKRWYDFVNAIKAKYPDAVVKVSNVIGMSATKDDMFVCIYNTGATAGTKITY